MFVPLPVDTVRLALTESDRVARCVPGLQQDADAAAGGPLAGRLRVRIGGSTITYRGSLRIAERGAGFEVAGEGTEARGSGSVKLALTVVPKAVSGGTALVCSGTVRSEGRLAEFDEQAAVMVARRLLDRFGAALATGLEKEPVATPDDVEDVEDIDTADDGVAVDDVGDLDDIDDVEDVAEVGDLSELSELEELGELDDEPPAEAAHARRTMIGRSTEEVDHAPPRGRYAPVPAPQTVSSGIALRWAAPAAAVVLASAVVVSRVLRRRK